VPNETPPIPEGLLTVEGALRARGCPEDAVAAILGGSFRPVAERAWRQP